MVVFDYIWPDNGEKVDLVRFLFGKLDMFFCLGFMVYQPLQATQYQILFIHITNLKFSNEYLVDNILNESEPICLHTIKLL